jgi:hypothetical protein
MRVTPEPLDAARLVANIDGHEGIDEVRYAAPTRSVLVRYRTDRVQTEELVLRLALALSFDCGGAPVRVLAEPERVEFTDSALFSGVLLLAAGAARVLRPTSPNPSVLDWAAGGGTVLAVLDHAWREVSKRGYYDPEVLSVGYLATALARKNVLKPALLTWAATFGRHLLEAPLDGVTVRPVPGARREDGAPRYEVEIGRDSRDSAPARLLRMLQSFVRPALGGGRVYGRRSLVDEMVDVSRRHERVLDGMDCLPDGIPLRFHEEVF